MAWEAASVVEGCEDLGRAKEVAVELTLSIGVKIGGE